MISLTAFRELVDYVIDGSRFPESIFHGENHWRAVASQGLLVADICQLGETGRVTAALFGVLHDCRRINDDYDPEHGHRAAQALQDCGMLSGLDPILKEKLTHSLTLHDAGQVTHDPIVGLGWDADRSVLTRCDIEPDFSFFSCIHENDFDMLISQGYEATDNPPEWDEIWHRAFSNDFEPAYLQGPR